MHKDDQMTPKERAAALSKGQSVDRMPISLMYFAPSAALAGYTPDRMFESGRMFATLQEKIYETFGQDGVTAKYGLHAMGIAFGATELNPVDGSRAIINHPIRNICDQSILNLEQLTPERDKEIRRTWECAHILLEEVGDEVGVAFGATGPFTCAHALLGAENMMRSIIKHPEEMHQLLKFTTAACIQIGKPFMELGLGLTISEPMASGVLLSEKMFREFVLPYEREFISALKAVKNAKATLHICGDTTKLLEAMADTGVDTISLDNMVDIEVAKAAIGSRCALMGNVDPNNVMLMGTTEDVERAVENCYRKGYDNPKGYLMATGCDSPMATPLENGLAYMKAARRCAKYPIDPANFEQK